MQKFSHCTQKSSNQISQVTENSLAQMHDETTTTDHCGLVNYTYCIHKYKAKLQFLCNIYWVLLMSSAETQSHPKVKSFFIILLMNSYSHHKKYQNKKQTIKITQKNIFFTLLQPAPKQPSFIILDNLLQK